MPDPRRWVIVLSIMQVAQVDRWDNSALAILMKGRQSGALGDDVVLAVDIFLLVNSAVSPDQKDRKFLSHLTKVFIGDHSHLVLLDALLKLTVLHLERSDLLPEVFEDI